MISEFWQWVLHFPPYLQIPEGVMSVPLAVVGFAIILITGEK